MERQKMKEARRLEVKARKAEAGPRPKDFDPDIAGLKPGPQEMPDWQREFFEEEQKAKEEAAMAALAAEQESE